MAPARPFAVLVAVCVVALAACGSSPKPSGSGSANTHTPVLQFAQCMRSSGVTKYPDPSSTGRPVAINQVDPNAPAFLRAYTACRKYVPGGQIGPPPPTAAELRAALAFAHCIRAHGVPQFPDPLTTYGSGFTLGRGEYFNVSPSEVESPAFTHAAKTCGVQLASGPPPS